ncbi:MAG: class I SAM-dependent methyltransferase [Thermoanaerobaculia bacterium]|nr:class I SAM-dependent methyltransferase [Thermoanaerobaculia bacterium]
MLRIVLFVVAALVAALGLFLASGGVTTLKRWAYEEPGRDGWQQPERVVESLGLAAGDRVADVGAGGGYFSFRFAAAVGDEGRVFAADLDRGLLDYVAKEAEKRGYANIRTVLAAPDDPRLPEPVDLLFTCNTAHHFADRVVWFRGVRRYLAPGGRLAVVDYFDMHGSAPPEQLEAELVEAGYRVVERPDFLSRQYFLIAEPDSTSGT